VNLGALWTGILEFLGQIIIPIWNDLIQYLPLLVLLGLIAFVGLLAWMWARNANSNRSRVPAPIPAGRKPQDTHLPGPSLWPFVAPAGLLLIVFSVALGPLESILNMGLLLAGMTVALGGIVGWYFDARKEYVQLEAGGHGAGSEATADPPGWSLSPPAGMHLPGPSAWPLLAPVGLLFLVSGLIFGAAMFIGGAIMALIAIVGWLGDANKELEDVEEHGHPTQADRDPDKAWPRKLIPVYLFIGALAILASLLPWLLSLLPGSGS
jgi:hypothetical protein